LTWLTLNLVRLTGLSGQKKLLAAGEISDFVHSDQPPVLTEPIEGIPCFQLGVAVPEP
jgi:hypothetical protein